MLRIVEGLVLPMEIGLVTVFSLYLVDERSVGNDYDGVDKGEREAVVFQNFDREVVLVEVLVHL